MLSLTVFYLYTKLLPKELDTIEKEIDRLIEEIHPHYMSILGIGTLSAAVIYSEYGDISNFFNPGQMLAFAGIEPGINDLGIESRKVRLEKSALLTLHLTSRM